MSPESQRKQERIERLRAERLWGERKRSPTSRYVAGYAREEALPKGPKGAKKGSQKGARKGSKRDPAMGPKGVPEGVRNGIPAR